MAGRARATHAKERAGSAFTALKAEARYRLPDRLERAGSITNSFDQARDPYIRAQLDDLAKTESQRRAENGRIPQMVKRHRPFPELRPRHETAPLRQAFNNAWLQEQRAAILARFDDEQQAQQTRSQDERGLDRSSGRER